MAGDDKKAQFQIALIEYQEKLALEQMMTTAISSIEKKKSETSSQVAQNFK